MPAALPLQSSISQATQGETNFRVIEIHYGNGYSQRAGDGYNSNQGSYSLSWENINLTDFTTLVTAFDTANGVDYFTWQPAGDATSKKWIVQKYQRQVTSGGVYTVSATLMQVFDL